MNFNDLKRTWRQVPKLLKWLLAVALGGASMILGLRALPEKWILGEECGQVLTTLALAYVGGFITSFLWHHFRWMLDNQRQREFRLSVIETIAMGHNILLAKMVHDENGIRP